jgi:hypothetical protein
VWCGFTWEVVTHGAAQLEFQAALFDMPGDPQAQRLLQQAWQGKR